MNIRTLFLTTGILAALALPLLATPAHAAPQGNTITVTTTSDEYNTSGTGAGCSLREAITAANTDAPFGGCPTGSGDDSILLSGSFFRVPPESAIRNSSQG